MSPPLAEHPVVASAAATQSCSATSKDGTAPKKPSTNIQELAAKLDMEAKTLAVVGGTGPFGEYDRSAKFYTLGSHPPELDLPKLTQEELQTRIQRHDIEGHDGLAFVIDGVLSEEEADTLAAVSERIGYSRFAPNVQTPPGMRQNKASHWVAPPSTAKAFLEPLYDRFKHLLPQEIEGSLLYDKLSHRVAHYKYDNDDIFNRHTDGSWPGQCVNATQDGIEEWPGVFSELTMLLYLNEEEDGFTGGATRLFRHDGSGYVDVKPKKGSALFFRHGFGPDSVMHMGRRVHGDTPKYVVRMNVLYG